ncbi:MAG: TPM domain-containing protein, partial [Oscillospiraceae bacterium]|nr:TPM domain-containing protein [Oscillospiraceae bacterium]
MVKKNAKNIFSALLIFVAILCLLAPMFCTQAYAMDTYGTVGVDTKPPVKKTGSYGSSVVIADYDNCLTESEESKLLEILHEAAKKAKCNVGIVITKDLEGKSDEGYNRAFIKENFGDKSNSVVLLLLNRYNNPKYSGYTDTITSYGTADKKFGNRYKKMFDRIYDKMGEPKGTKTPGGYTPKTLP